MTQLRPKVKNSFTSSQARHSIASQQQTMESIQRFSHRLLVPLPFVALKSNSQISHFRIRIPISKLSPFDPKFAPFADSYLTRRSYVSPTPPSLLVRRSGWLLGLGEKKQRQVLPEIVKAGDPVLHEPAQEVKFEEIGSDRVQKMIDDMIKAMRMGPGVGLAAPQIGIPLQIIVLEDTKEYISYAPKEDLLAQDRRQFDLLVIVNPKLKNKGNKSALFFEGCLSVDGYRAVVERHLEVEVTGLDRFGQPIKVDAAGWQARILQHECDHLNGTLYVDKMVPKTFRIVENLNLPLANGVPKLGVRNSG